MQVIGFNAEGAISVVIDGIDCIVPDDMRNRHRRLVADWVSQGNVIPPYAAPSPTVEDVAAERSRRLALGFDFDFADARGVHHIGTSEADLKNWDEVTKISTAAILAGIPGTEIGIKTETGAVSVTAAEWQQVLLAAGQHRQPFFQASFALQEMDPIPADYATNPAYWPS